MKLSTSRRILTDQFRGRSWRELYWAYRNSSRRLAALLRPANWSFGRHVVENFCNFIFGGARGIQGETKKRAKAAVAWILKAQEKTGGGGVSLGYFPCASEKGWQRAYPETTGYIIPSLLEFADLYRDETVRERALRMANWEIEVQMDCGAVQGGMFCTREKQTPATFNTGMALAGWSAAYRATRDRSFLEAGQRAADFLVKDIRGDGYFSTNSEFVNQSEIKTYNCLCAWALYQFSEDVDEMRYREAAIKLVEGALRQQKANGWFANNCLTNPNAPLLHTICYTLQGVLEVGVLANRGDFVSAVERGTDPLVDRVSPDGFLHGRFYPDWEPACFSSCLTGSAQLAVVLYRLYEILRRPRYRAAADRLVNFLKSLQTMDSVDDALNGALGGSFPLTGAYMTVGYPNWATKYFLDGLMLQEKNGCAQTTT